MHDDRHVIPTRATRLEHWLFGLMCATAVLAMYVLSAGLDEADALNLAEAEADRAAAYHAGRLAGREEALVLLRREVARVEAQCQRQQLTTGGTP